MERGSRRATRERRVHALLPLAALFLILGGAAARAADGPGGAIRGVVVDRDFAVPLAGVRVSVVEALRNVSTDSEGAFLVEPLEPGSYTVVFVKDGFERRVQTGVSVSAGRMTDLRVELGLEVVEMEELVVTGADLLGDSELGLLEIRSLAVSLQDAISSELIGKAGVGDVAGALKLVVGTSIVDGKYATVRGLSDRYTGTTLNGIRVPSADPRRRAVQVDLFPTETIESVTVTKTFTPDLSGEFTGGGVDIRTKSIPEGYMLKLSLSAERNSEATGNADYLTYRGGGIDPTGFADDRDLPREAGPVALAALPRVPAFSPNPTAAQMEASLAYDRLVHSFAPAMGVSSETPGDNRSFSVVSGNRFRLGKQTLGVLGALSYSHKYDFYADGQNNTALVSDKLQPFTLASPRTDSKGTEELLIGTLGNLVWQPSANNEIALRLIANHSAEDTARLQIENTGGNSTEQNQALHYTERTVGSAQLEGRHRPWSAAGTGAFSGLALDWVAAHNLTRQDEPDVRFFRNTFDNGTFSGGFPLNSSDFQNTRRIFREIAEDNGQAGLNLTFPFRRRNDREGKIKLGAFVDRTNREFDQSSFAYHFETQSGSIFNAARSCNQATLTFRGTGADQLWTDIFTNPDMLGLAPRIPTCPFNPNGIQTPAANQLLWTIRPLGDDVDYTGDQEIGAFYAMAEIPLGARWTAVLGARQESTSLSVVPVNERFGIVEVIETQASGTYAIIEVPQERARARLDERDLLPALGLIHEIRPGMKLRASWSRTVARPTFRELAPIATEEFIFGDEVIGNPELTLSGITNNDLRWEWFRADGGLLAASLFAKRIDDPIEVINFSAANRSFVQPVNYERGEVSGFELEARTSLEFLAAPLRQLTIGANATRIRSEVEIPATEREALDVLGLGQPRRRLQGQPEYLLNWNLGYETPRGGTSVGLFYNRVGETLNSGAARGVEDGNADVFQEPFTTLDLTVKQRIPGLGKHMAVDLEARNLLTPTERSVYRRPNGEEAIKTERETALRVSLGVKFEW